MNVDKITLLEEFVNCIGNQTANAENSLKGIGTRAQMRHCAQIFQRVPFGLDREVGRRRAFHRYMHRLNLKGLLRIRRQLHSSFHDQGRTDIDFCNLVEIIQRFSDHHLYRIKEGAIGEHDETKCLGGSAVSHPPAQLDRFAGKGGSVAVKISECE